VEGLGISAAVERTSQREIRSAGKLNMSNNADSDASAERLISRARRREASPRTAKFESDCTGTVSGK